MPKVPKAHPDFSIKRRDAQMGCKRDLAPYLFII